MISSQRSVLVLFASLLVFALPAQHIDSVHVFRTLPAGDYTSATAEGMAWRLHRSHAAYVTLGPSVLENLNEELARHRPAEHDQAKLPSLAYLGLTYSHGAVHVACILGDLEAVVDLTARREFRMADWSDRLKLKGLLLSLGL